MATSLVCILSFMLQCQEPGSCDRHCMAKTKNIYCVALYRKCFLAPALRNQSASTEIGLPDTEGCRQLWAILLCTGNWARSRPSGLSIHLLSIHSFTYSRIHPRTILSHCSLPLSSSEYCQCLWGSHCSTIYGALQVVLPATPHQLRLKEFSI